MPRLATRTERADRSSQESADEEQEEEEPFDLDLSIFAGRKKIADSRGYFDGHKVRRRALDIDWARANDERFRSFIGTNDDDGRAAVDAELKEIRKVFEKHASLVAGVYSLYCAVLDRAYDGYVMSLLAVAPAPRTHAHTPPPPRAAARFLTRAVGRLRSGTSSCATSR